MLKTFFFLLFWEFFLFFHTHVTNSKLTLCLGSTWSNSQTTKLFKEKILLVFFFFPLKINCEKEVGWEWKGQRWKRRKKTIWTMMMMDRQVCENWNTGHKLEEQWKEENEWWKKEWRNGSKSKKEQGEKGSLLISGLVSQREQSLQGHQGVSRTFIL